MGKITYDNFKDLECEFAKYVSLTGGKFRLNVVNYKKFKRELLNRFSDNEIQYFFENFPHTLESLTNEEDKVLFMTLECEFYDDLHIIELEDKNYVLYDETSEIFVDWDIVDKIKSQPVLFEDFAELLFEDFVKMHTGSLLFDIKYQFKDD